MNDTYVTCTVSPCVIVHQIDLPPFQLDAAAGAEISVAIAGVWVVGWIIRVIIRTLNIDGGSSNSESET